MAANTGSHSHDCFFSSFSSYCLHRETPQRSYAGGNLDEEKRARGNGGDKERGYVVVWGAAGSNLHAFFTLPSEKPAKNEATFLPVHPRLEPFPQISHHKMQTRKKDEKYEKFPPKFIPTVSASKGACMRSRGCKRKGLVYPRWSAFLAFHCGSLSPLGK